MLANCDHGQRPIQLPGQSTVSEKKIRLWIYDHLATEREHDELREGDRIHQETLSIHSVEGEFDSFFYHFQFFFGNLCVQIEGYSAMIVRLEKF